MKEDEIQKALQERIGAKLTELRKRKGFTSHETFANEFEIPRVQYWRLEKGRSNLTIRTLARLLVIHKMSFDEFLSELLKDGKKKK